jgi:hypothetical protein
VEKEIEKQEKVVKQRVVVGKPVKWIKRIKLSQESNISVNLTKTANNITVNRIVNNASIPLNKNRIKIKHNNEVKKIDEYETGIKIDKIKEQIAELNRQKRIHRLNITKIRNINQRLNELNNRRNDITGFVIADLNQEGGFLTRFFSWFNGITGMAILDEETVEEEVELIIEEYLEEVEIEYYTEAPKAEEIIESDTRKKIIISDENEIGYTDVLAYSKVNDVKLESIKLYHIINDTRIQTEFDAYDTNDNSLVDYIEWIVPHLSDQSYELIIEISGAEHLDEDRSFIADIYDEVKALDNITVVIPSGDYVRVSFESNLSSSRDITLYAQSIANSSVVHAYKADSDDIITTFNISSFAE